MDKKTFAQLQTELEELLDWFETADFDIEASLEKYKQAQAVIDELEKRLKTAETRISKIKADLRT